MIYQKRFFITFVVLVIISACNFPVAESPVGDSSPSSDEAPNNRFTPPSPEPSPGTTTGDFNEMSCDYLHFDPVLDTEVRQIPSLDKPSTRMPFRDPVFGTCQIRVSDWRSDTTGEESMEGLKNEYSRIQAFNADDSLLMAYSTQGNWYLYDARSFQPLGRVSLEVEPRWDAVDPDLIYSIDETRLIALRLSTGEAQIIHDFADDFPGRNLSMVWTRYEGSPSLDSRYWGLMAQDQDWEIVAFLIYDLQHNLVIAKRETPDHPDVDSVTISPLGTYFLAFFDEYCEHGQLGNDSRPCGLMVYDQNLENGRSLVRIIGHSDLALDAQGNEVLVFQDIDEDTISMLDLRDGKITPLLSIDFSHSSLGLHFSGRATNTPGWIVVSTYNGARPSATWMDDQVFAVELVEQGRVIRLAHTHSQYDENIEKDYWAEPHASVNRDLTQIVFTSNWGRSGTEDVDMYLIKLPPQWLTSLP